MIKVISLFVTVSLALVSSGLCADSETMVIADDVDVYDEPGGEGNVISMLRKGAFVEVLGCRDDQWCHTNYGWVWEDFLEPCARAGCV